MSRQSQTLDQSVLATQFSAWDHAHKRHRTGSDAATTCGRVAEQTFPAAKECCGAAVDVGVCADKCVQVAALSRDARLGSWSVSFAPSTAKLGLWRMHGSSVVHDEFGAHCIVVSGTHFELSQ